ncbi:MAG: hypothetical protein FWF45_00295 [Coriobacteriia bacterium]|nr:hypothetical protein [Coriobacteriia bacterium]
MKKHAVILTICLILTTILMAGCGTKAPMTSAKDTVSAAMGAYQAGDFTKFASYWTDANQTKLTGAKDPKKLLGNTGISEDTATAFLKALGAAGSYKITSDSEDVSAKNATVEVQFLGVDMEKMSADTAFQNELSQQLAADPNFKNMTADERADATINLMIKTFRNTANKTISTVTVNLVIAKDHNGASIWKINNDTLLQPLFGNIPTNN